MRDIDKRCKDCRYRVVDELASYEELSGKCYRFPPTTEGMVYPLHPIVRERDWCFEWAENI